MRLVFCILYFVGDRPTDAIPRDPRWPQVLDAGARANHILPVLHICALYASGQLPFTNLLCPFGGLPSARSSWAIWVSSHLFIKLFCHDIVNRNWINFYNCRENADLTALVESFKIHPTMKGTYPMFFIWIFSVTNFSGKLTLSVDVFIFYFYFLSNLYFFNIFLVWNKMWVSITHRKVIMTTVLITLHKSHTHSLTRKSKCFFHS